MAQLKFKVEMILDQKPEDKAFVESVQLNNSKIDPSGRNKEKFPRWQAVKIVNQTTGGFTIRSARGGSGKQGLTKDSIVLDYDGKIELDIQKDKNNEIWVQQASLWEVTWYYYRHKNPMIRMTTRLAVIGVVLGFLGFIVGVVPFLFRLF